MIEQYLPMIEETLKSFLTLGIELSVLFFLISGLVGLVQQYVPESRIKSVLGGKYGTGYIFAVFLGTLTPFCSCSTIPMLRGLIKAKAGFGPTLTFLFTSPLLNPVVVSLFIVTFGWRVTAAYACIAVIIAITAGFILSRSGFEKYIIPENETQLVSCCDSQSEKKPITLTTLTTTKSCCSTPEPVVIDKKPTFWMNVKTAFKESAKQFKKLFPYLLLGVAIGSIIHGFVPGDLIAKYAGDDNLFAIPIAAVIGIPLYLRVETLIPLSAALVSKGMSLGAVMALIIGGAGASLTEVILLKSMFKTPMIIAFLTV
ncbi:permease, partial [Methanimicrococcus sp. OttesenSCG-928-J09]|nr:permease [Methanimicrococcus sp. OttesenSCG-928-J09]